MYELWSELTRFVANYHLKASTSFNVLLDKQYVVNLYCFFLLFFSMCCTKRYRKLWYRCLDKRFFLVTKDKENLVYFFKQLQKNEKCIISMGQVHTRLFKCLFPCTVSTTGLKKNMQEGASKCTKKHKNTYTFNKFCIKTRFFSPCEKISKLYAKWAKFYVATQRCDYSI